MVKIIVVCALINSVCFQCCALEVHSPEKSRQVAGAVMARQTAEERQFNTCCRDSETGTSKNNPFACKSSSRHKRVDSKHKRVGSMSPSNVEELGLDNSTIKICLTQLAQELAHDQDSRKRGSIDRESQEYLQDLALNVPSPTNTGTN